MIRVKINNVVKTVRSKRLFFFLVWNGNTLTLTLQKILQGLTKTLVFLRDKTVEVAGMIMTKVSRDSFKMWDYGRLDGLRN